MAAEMNPLAVVRACNIRKLMAHHGVSITDIAHRTGLSHSALSQNFSEANGKPRPASSKTMVAVLNYFKLWEGALDTQDFDPEVTPIPHTSLSLTLNISNISDLDIKRLKKLFTQLGDLVDG